MKALTPRCPYCLDDLSPEDPSVRCATCRTPHHAACFEEHGGCCSFGCAGRAEVAAGPSVFLRAPRITVRVRPTEERVLGPFGLRWQVLDRLSDVRWNGPPVHARLSLEDRETREGQVLRGRGAVYLPEPARVRGVDLVLRQGIARQALVARVTLLDGRELGAGTHPFAFELCAPGVVGPVDPFLVELVLARGFFLGDVRSPLLPVFLLERRDGRLERHDAVIIQPPVADEPPPRGPFAAPGPDGWCRLAAPGRDGAEALEVAARPGAPGASGELALQAQVGGDGSEVFLRVEGRERLARLTLGVRWELGRPGGGEVAAPGFPATQEVVLLGPGALDPASYGPAALDVSLRVPPAHLAAAAQARREVVHNAALRVLLGLDAATLAGRALRASRTVTITA